jgi:hypothetical protein
VGAILSAASVGSLLSWRARGRILAGGRHPAHRK